MKRKIIQIDEEKCNGCGLCAEACHEGAIEMRGGKAHLIRDDYCDGLGDCLPECPAGAITITEREAAAYSREAVEEKKQEERRRMEIQEKKQPCGCPGSRPQTIGPQRESAAEKRETDGPQSELRTWPVQIRLAPVCAPYFQNARLLIAADCTAYAYARFHQDFLRGHVVLIGCPKLDQTDYTEKLQQILEGNEIRSLEIVRMEVPCCGGLEQAAVQALKKSGKFIPWRTVTITLGGEIAED